MYKIEGYDQNSNLKNEDSSGGNTLEKKPGTSPKGVDGSMNDYMRGLD